jgi:hypothetical protein
MGRSVEKSADRPDERSNNYEFDIEGGSDIEITFSRVSTIHID